MKPLSRVELRRALVPRDPDGHKGAFGHVLVAAGSRGMAGAAVLAGRAALRSGAGLVTVAVPESLQALVAGAVPEAMTLGLPETSEGTIRPEAAARIGRSHEEKAYTVMALGPGLSTHPETARFVVAALGSLPLPALVDADALNNLATQERRTVEGFMLARVQSLVLTPHPGEMARLLSLTAADVQRDREGAARRLAAAWKAVVVLKGRRSVVCGGERAAVNVTGGPGLAKGGTGDALTGLIAGLWAQSLASGRAAGDAAFLAAALGAHVHGRAGDIAARELTPYAMTAQDVIDRFTRAFKSL